VSGQGEIATPSGRVVGAGSSTPPSIVRIRDALRELVPSSVRTGVRSIDEADEATLWPIERAAVASAVRSRRIEFATGRALLRELLDLDAAIPVRPDRRPEFPDGTVGTLAHDQDIAVAATAHDASCRALGIDIEPTTELEADLVALICRPEERHLDAHLVFVLKEATYKAWSSLGGRMLEHREVSVRIDHHTGEFAATTLPDAVDFTGRYVTVEHRHLALVTVER
jgi:4'-phosphopantetheinyl transferase EntD